MDLSKREKADYVELIAECVEVVCTYTEQKRINPRTKSMTFKHPMLQTLSDARLRYEVEA